MLDEVAADESITVLVLTGGVPGYFVAHADLDDLSARDGAKPSRATPAAGPAPSSSWQSMPQPVVAAVNGQAWGGGCELSLACTLRVAAASAHFGQPEVVVGIIPGAGGTQRLPRAVGPGRAAELVLSGRIIDAQEAERIGLVRRCCPTRRLRRARARVGCSAMATKPRHAVVAAKRAWSRACSLPLDEGLQLEGRLFIECQMRPETVALEERAADREKAAPPASASTSEPF